MHPAHAHLLLQAEAAVLGHKAAPSPVRVAGCRQQTRNCAQGSRAADHFCPHTAEISAVTRSLHDTSLLGLPFLMYSSLAPAGTCPAKVSELQMDVAFADREDFDSCRLEREASKPTVFQHRVEGTPQAKYILW